MLQVSKIVLEITFDNDLSDHPASWDWPGILEMVQVPIESVKLVESGSGGGED